MNITTITEHKNIKGRFHDDTISSNAKGAVATPKASGAKNKKSRLLKLLLKEQRVAKIVKVSANMDFLQEKNKWRENKTRRTTPFRVEVMRPTIQEKQR